MKRLRSAGLCLLVLFLLSLTVDLTFGQESENQEDFLLKEYTTGENKSFGDVLISKVNIMIVTETTCVSCIKEMKSLEWLRARYRGDLAVTAVFIDRQGWSRVSKYVDYYAFDLDMFLVDAGGVVPQRFDATFVPTLIIFDRDGNERFRKTGFTEGEESLISARIDEVLANPTIGRAAEADAGGADVDTTAPAVKKTTGCASTA